MRLLTCRPMARAAFGPGRKESAAGWPRDATSTYISTTLMQETRPATRSRSSSGCKMKPFRVLSCKNQRNCAKSPSLNSQHPLPPPALRLDLELSRRDSDFPRLRDLRGVDPKNALVELGRHFVHVDWILHLDTPIDVVRTKLG